MTIAVVTSDLYPPRLRRLERKEASLHSAIVPQVGLCPHGADVRSVAMDRDTAAFERLFAQRTAVEAYVDPWLDRAEPKSPAQFTSALPLLPLPRVPVR